MKEEKGSLNHDWSLTTTTTGPTQSIRKEREEIQLIETYTNTK